MMFDEGFEHHLGEGMAIDSSHVLYFFTWKETIQRKKNSFQLALL